MMTYEEMKKHLDDPWWRVTSGVLYKIMIKDEDEDGDGEGNSYVIPFKLRPLQREILENLWYRNIIPKARQHGVTTLFSIVLLDHALFVDNQRCGLIAHDLKSGKAIFRDKVKFAYDNLPARLKDGFPLVKNSADELLFAHNNSSVQVSNALRSGTIHRLHISEYGKICARYPEKAKEVITGSIPSVPLKGIITIESTAEGPEGDFHRKTMRAKKNRDSGKKLTIREYRLHFFPWWVNDDYQMDPEGVIISDKDNEYFDEVEAKNDIELNQEQCAWYVATRDADYEENEELMWREYPSWLDEAFQKSGEGKWFAKQMNSMRKQKRIKALPTVHTVPCMTFWDIGGSDGTAIWVIQKVGHEFRVIRFFEMWDEPYATSVAWLQGLGLVFDTHYLPHDATHVKQLETSMKSPEQMVGALMPGARFEIVERIEDVTWGIQQTRDVFPLLFIDEMKCKEGIAHLDAYSKKWNTVQQRWTDVPNKIDGHSEAADALRQFGQAYAAGQLNVRKQGKTKPPKSWRTA